MKIIEDKCRVENGKLIVTVEGTDPSVVLSSEAKMLAIKKATQLGFPRIGINGQSGSYPVDKEGKSHDDWNDMALRNEIFAYRNDIVLMNGL